MKRQSATAFLFLCAVGSFLCPTHSIQIDADFGVDEVLGLTNSDDFSDADSGVSGWAADEDFELMEPSSNFSDADIEAVREQMMASSGSSSTESHSSVSSSSSVASPSSSSSSNTLVDIDEPSSKDETFDDDMPSRRLLALAPVFPIRMTADNKFTLYINGKRIGSGNSWTRTYSFNPRIGKVYVVAIDAIDRGGPAAIIGSFGGKRSIASQWRCKDYNNGRPPRNWYAIGFNDRSWPRARSYGNNNANNVWRRVSRSSRPRIPSNAQWFWTRDYNNHNRVFCRMTVATPKPATRRITKRVLPRKAYTKINSFLSQLRSQVNKQTKSAGLLTKTEINKQNAVNRNIKNVLRTISATQKNLASAKRAYLNYKRSSTTASSNDKALLASLRRQRSFISVERAYINKMEAESVSLKKHTPRYTVIRTEIRQMRAQVNKEVADVERAYARLRAKTSSTALTLKRRLATATRNMNRLQSLLSSYKARHNALKVQLIRAQNLRAISVVGKKTLVSIANGLVELESHVHEAVKRQISPNYRYGLSQCKTSRRNLQKKYSRMRCTK